MTRIMPERALETNLAALSPLAEDVVASSIETGGKTLETLSLRGRVTLAIDASGQLQVYKQKEGFLGLIEAIVQAIVLLFQQHDDRAIAVFLKEMSSNPLFVVKAINATDEEFRQMLVVKAVASQYLTTTPLPEVKKALVELIAGLDKLQVARQRLEFIQKQPNDPLAKKIIAAGGFARLSPEVQIALAKRIQTCYVAFQNNPSLLEFARFDGLQDVDFSDPESAKLIVSADSVTFTSSIESRFVLLESVRSFATKNASSPIAAKILQTFSEKFPSDHAEVENLIYLGNLLLTAPIDSSKPADPQILYIFAHIFQEMEPVSGMFMSFFIDETKIKEFVASYARREKVIGYLSKTLPGSPLLASIKSVAQNISPSVERNIQVLFERIQIVERAFSPLLNKPELHRYRAAILNFILSYDGIGAEGAMARTLFNNTYLEPSKQKELLIKLLQKIAPRAILKPDQLIEARSKWEALPPLKRMSLQGFIDALREKAPEALAAAEAHLREARATISIESLLPFLRRTVSTAILDEAKNAAADKANEENALQEFAALYKDFGTIPSERINLTTYTDMVLGFVRAEVTIRQSEAIRAKSHTASETQRLQTVIKILQQDVVLDLSLKSSIQRALCTETAFGDQVDLAKTMLKAKYRELLTEVGFTELDFGVYLASADFNKFVEAYVLNIRYEAVLASPHIMSSYRAKLSEGVRGTGGELTADMKARTLHQVASESLLSQGFSAELVATLNTEENFKKCARFLEISGEVVRLVPVDDAESAYRTTVAKRLISRTLALVMKDQSLKKPFRRAIQMALGSTSLEEDIKAAYGLFVDKIKAEYATDNTSKEFDTELNAALNTAGKKAFMDYFMKDIIRMAISSTEVMSSNNVKVAEYEARTKRKASSELKVTLMRQAVTETIVNAFAKAGFDTTEISAYLPASSYLEEQVAEAM